VIGDPPNVSVPTHFAKVVLAARPSSPSTPQVPEISTGAFVLPNAAIPEETSLESFVVPGNVTFIAVPRTLTNVLRPLASRHRRAGLRSNFVLGRYQRRVKAHLQNSQM
jgi:endonuclease G, mitochondrial